MISASFHRTSSLAQIERLSSCMSRTEQRLHRYLIWRPGIAGLTLEVQALQLPTGATAVSLIFTSARGSAPRALHSKQC